MKNWFSFFTNITVIILWLCSCAQSQVITSEDGKTQLPTKEVAIVSSIQNGDEILSSGNQQSSTRAANLSTSTFTQSTLSAMYSCQNKNSGGAYVNLLASSLFLMDYSCTITLNPDIALFTDNSTNTSYYPAVGSVISRASQTPLIALSTTARGTASALYAQVQTTQIYDNVGENPTFLFIITSVNSNSNSITKGSTIPIIGTGDGFSCALTRPGSSSAKLYCWGTNSNVFPSALSTPTLISGTPTDANNLYVGDELICVTSPSVGLKCLGAWGSVAHSSWSVITSTNPSVVAVGYQTICYTYTVSSASKVGCLGTLDFTNSAQTENSSTVVEMTAFNGLTVSGLAIASDPVSARNGAICAIVGTNLNVQCAGSNNKGQLGNTTSTFTSAKSSSITVSISGSSLAGISKLYAKGSTFLAATSGGALYGWGQTNDMGWVAKTSFPSSTSSTTAKYNLFGVNSLDSTTGSGQTYGGGFLYGLNTSVTASSLYTTSVISTNSTKVPATSSANCTTNCSISTSYNTTTTPVTLASSGFKQGFLGLGAYCYTDYSQNVYCNGVDVGKSTYSFYIPGKTYLTTAAPTGTKVETAQYTDYACKSQTVNYPFSTYKMSFDFKNEASDDYTGETLCMPLTGKGNYSNSTSVSNYNFFNSAGIKGNTPTPTFPTYPSNKTTTCDLSNSSGKCKSCSVSSTLYIPTADTTVTTMEHCNTNITSCSSLNSQTTTNYITFSYGKLAYTSCWWGILCSPYLSTNTVNAVSGYTSNTGLVSTCQPSAPAIYPNSTSPTNYTGYYSATSYSYNTNTYTPPSLPTSVFYVAVGSNYQTSSTNSHVCAAAFDSSIYCWGGNDLSQSGSGSTTTPILAPYSSGTCASSSGVCY